MRKACAAWPQELQPRGTMTSMTWHCDGQDETRAESLMGLKPQGLRFHHGGRSRRRHRYVRAAQSRVSAPSLEKRRDELSQALAVERTTREALQRRIRELESKLAALSGAQGRPSASDEMALLDLKTSLSGAATGAVDLEPLQLWLAEAELRADAAEGAGGWSDGEIELIPSLVEAPGVGAVGRPEGARVAFEAAEARAAHNAAQVRRLTEELAEARAEQMKTMAKLRELEAKFRYAEERAGLAGEALQNYLPEPPSTWTQPDFVPEGEAEGGDLSLDDALAAWGSKGDLAEGAVEEASLPVETEDISLDEALESWGKVDADSADDGAPETADDGDDDLDDVLAAWGEGDLSGVGGQAVEEAEEASLEALSDALGAWGEEESGSEHQASGQTEEGDAGGEMELDPMTGSASGFTAQEPAADFRPEETEALAEEETAQPYLDSFATGEQADATSTPELEDDSLTEALTGWGVDEDETETTPDEAVQTEDEAAIQASEGDALTDDLGDSDAHPDTTAAVEDEVESSVGELDIDALDDVPLDEMPEEQPADPEALHTDEIESDAWVEPLEEAASSETVEAEDQKTEEEDPSEAHTWGAAITEELSDAEEARFESGLAAATSPVDYTGDLENDPETFEPDIALDEEAKTYENGSDRVQIDEQLSDEERADYDGELTPELHLDDEDKEQGTTELDEVVETAPIAEEVTSTQELLETGDSALETDFEPEPLPQADESRVDQPESFEEDSAAPFEEESLTPTEALDAGALETPGDIETSPTDTPETEPSIDVDTVVAARIAGREAVEGSADPESMRRSLRDWSGLAAARREKAAQNAAAEAEAEPTHAEAEVSTGQEERQGSLREKVRASREVHGKKKMVDALMRFMGDR